jgi:four helix bundle protein
MKEIASHRDLIAWQKGLRFGLEVYGATATFPDVERFGLVSQLRRAAVSVTSNIAEGFGRGSTVDYLRFLRMSRGALFEIDTQLLYALELGYLHVAKHSELQAKLEECSKILAGLIKSLESKNVERVITDA